VWQVPDHVRLELLAALSTDPARPATMSYQEFLAWADEDTLAEWVDGSVVMTSPASVQHQNLALFLSTLLATYARIHDLGSVLTAPFQMKLARSGREPDVLVVLKEHLGRLQGTFLAGGADLVVEIVSDESVGRDRGDKFEEYREAGIPEYWLLDPRVEQADFYWLDERGRYHAAPVDAAGVYRSRVLPHFWLRVDWLWQQPVPDPTTILLEVDRAAYAAYLQEQLRHAGTSGT
jgi:Uma2 family endonuclease